MQIEQLHIRNYKLFRDVQVKDIPRMAVFVGANGSGKSTLFDVFGFLAESLRGNVRVAVNKRGGLQELRSRGERGPIGITLKFRNTSQTGERNPLITYELEVDEDERGLPIVKRELLQYRRGRYGRPWRFLDFQEGSGKAITNEEEYGREGATEQREEQTLDSKDTLAIKGLGQFQRFRAISDFRKLLESWYIANFQIPDAKQSQEIAYAEQLSPTGHNLAMVAEYMYQHHREAFDEVLTKMERRVPGVSKVEADKTVDGRIVLRFHDGSFQDPFIARYVSDGTLKMFAYLLLLSEPGYRPLLCIEEPENYLYPDLLTELAEEFRAYAERGGQVFISTHSPDFVNALRIDELFWLEKTQGFSKIHRAKEDKQIQAMCRAGDELGSLWKQDFFAGADPTEH